MFKNKNPGRVISIAENFFDFNKQLKSKGLKVLTP